MLVFLLLFSRDHLSSLAHHFLHSVGLSLCLTDFHSASPNNTINITTNTNTILKFKCSYQWYIKMTWLGRDTQPSTWPCLFCLDLYLFVQNQPFFRRFSVELSLLSSHLYSWLPQCFLLIPSTPPFLKPCSTPFSSPGAYSVRCVWFSWWLFSPSISWWLKR